MTHVDYQRMLKSNFSGTKNNKTVEYNFSENASTMTFDSVYGDSISKTTTLSETYQINI